MATPNDKAVLEALFNPLFSEFGFPSDPDEQRTTEGEGIEAAPAEVIQLELEGVQAAEKGDIDKAIDLFGQAIFLVPQRASGYNNRAQAFRIKGDTERALEDLNNAVNLSQGQGHAASQALCQRGLIYRLQKREEEALTDFKEAAKLGNQFAKAQVVQMNPYAALCNKMLGQMFAKLKEGEESL